VTERSTRSWDVERTGCKWMSASDVALSMHLLLVFLFHRRNPWLSSHPPIEFLSESVAASTQSVCCPYDASSFVCWRHSCRSQHVDGGSGGVAARRRRRRLQ